MIRVFIFFFFLLFSTNLKAEKVYKIYGEQETGKVSEKCNGFCEGEKLNLTIASAVQKTKRIINGKKKTAPKWVEYRGINVPKTACIPFLSWNERAIPIDVPVIKDKKKRAEKLESYMKDFNQGTDMYNAYYEINSCMPCPPGYKTKRNKSGFCPIPMYSLEVVMKQAYDYGFIEFEDLSQVKLGRDITGDLDINLKDALKNIVYERLYLSEGLKSNIVFIRMIDKASNQRVYYYTTLKYKTASKQQPIKQEEVQFLDDEDLASNLDDMINNIQKNFSEVFNMKGSKFENFSLMYDLIPSNEDIELLKNNFPKAAAYHIQTRN